MESSIVIFFKEKIVLYFSMKMLNFDCTVFLLGSFMWAQVSVAGN